jgi:16S rRNA (uracil1498-N3)-methyltransferase
MIRKPGRTPRLHVDKPLLGDEIALDSRQAHYLRQVLRLKSGGTVVVFDGHGNERVAAIAKLTREGAHLRVTEVAEPIPESALELNLVQAVAKADAMDLIIQKATELGVRSISPVITEFSVVKLDAKRAERRREHWHRIAQSACEQSGRHGPPAIDEPRPLADCLGDLPVGGRRLVLDPRATGRFGHDASAHEPGLPLRLLIGPEGGFSHRDLDVAARAGFEPVGFGPRILRAETAAIAACALAQALWGDIV